VTLVPFLVPHLYLDVSGYGCGTVKTSRAGTRFLRQEGFVMLERNRAMLTLNLPSFSIALIGELCERLMDGAVRERLKLSGASGVRRCARVVG
jgi:hypothetical protein